MRELLGAFSGNELVFGDRPGQLDAADGHRLDAGQDGRPAAIADHRVRGRGNPHRPAALADVFLLRWLRNVVFLRGAEVGVTETVASCFVLLAPYCLVTGYVLTVACQVAATASCGRQPFRGRTS